MSILDELGKAVRSRRHEIGLSQARVAVLSGLPRKTVSRIETGTAADLAIDKAERLAQALGITLYVVERDDW